MPFFKTSKLQQQLASWGDYVGQKIGSLFRSGRSGPSRADAGGGTEEDRYLMGEDWVAVTSSNVALIRYIPAAEKLFIEFHNGATYSYSNVNMAEARDFYNAGSKGKWVWDYLRIRKTKLGHKKPYRMETIGEYVSKRIKRSASDVPGLNDPNYQPLTPPT